MPNSFVNVFIKDVLYNVIVMGVYFVLDMNQEKYHILVIRGIGVYSHYVH